MCVCGGVLKGGVGVRTFVHCTLCIVYPILHRGRSSRIVLNNV